MGTIIYSVAVAQIVRAGLAPDYRAGVESYAHRFVHTRCNVITRASLAAILAEAPPENITAEQLMSDSDRRLLARAEATLTVLA